jgi:hypothetical protein
MAMICSSLNRDRFIVRTPLPKVGLYPNLEEFAGLRSAGTSIAPHLLPRLPERIGGVIGTGGAVSLSQQVTPGAGAPEGAVEIPTR